MAEYCVNKNEQDNGDHEVHVEGCGWLPEPENQQALGDFDNCEDAVEEAKKYYSQTNGCAHCCPDCNTG